MLKRSTILSKIQKHNDAKEYPHEVFRIFSQENYAYGIMSAYMQLGVIFSCEDNIFETVAAVKKAVDYGLVNVEEFLCKPCFASLRSLPEYFELLNAKRPWLQDNKGLKATFKKQHH